MRIRLEHNGTVFEYERRPMPEGRFKAVWAVAALCGGWGVLMVAVVTLVVVMIASA